MLTKKDFEAYTPYVLSAQAGDPEAFSELYKRTYRQQYAMIHKFFNDTHLCEDLLQDVYIKLFQTIGNIEKPHYFIGYLNQITYHTCISYKRKRSFQMENTVEEEMLLDVAETHTPSIPEDQALQVEKIEIFSEGLRQLSDDERYIFLLRFSEKMKLEDIALSTGLSRSTIKRRLNTAKSKMKLFLTEQGMRGFIFAPLAAECLQETGLVSTHFDALKSSILKEVSTRPRASDSYLRPFPDTKKTSHLLQFTVLLLLFIGCTGLLLCPAAICTFMPLPHKDTLGPSILDYKTTEETLSIQMTDDINTVDYSSIYGVTENGVHIKPQAIQEENNTVIFAIPETSMSIYATDSVGNTSVATLSVPENE